VREKSMNEVITKLDEIEEKAGAILSDARSRKDELMRQLEQDKRDIDAEYEKKDKEASEKLKSQRLAEASGQIIKLEQENQAAIDRLDGLYEERGEALAEEIFKRVTGKVS
jgi:hypothetical protein